MSAGVITGIVLVFLVYALINAEAF
ncbi:potassium-transporting ATPase subunit F [Salmonella enterica]|nr:potassium-transporting ATPase subunit F [Salmonella enterica]